MKTRFTLLLLLAAFHLQAQNYRCIQSDSTGWYTNGSYYLRAVRIDSVRTAGGVQHCYPFKTPRGNIHATTSPSQTDTTGGSWLGSRILVWPDGTTGFLNGASDTVFIRTGAAPGETWTFYDDTSAVRYEATAMASDWRLLWPGTFDSVKEIRLQMKTGSTNLSSYKNSYRLLLSKEHGLVQAFDFWNFPYRNYDPVSSSNYLDYFLSLNPPTDTSKALFRKIRFTNLRYRDAYSWQPGDVFQYATDLDSRAPIVGEYITDSVMGRTETASAIQFQLARTRVWGELQPASNIILTKVETSQASQTVSTPDSPVFSFARLPEEWPGSRLIFHYGLLPKQGFESCPPPLALSWSSSNIQPDGRLDLGEACGVTYRYSLRRGREDYARCLDPTWGGEGALMIYCKTDGQRCGERNTLSVPAASAPDALVSAFPNPVSGRLGLRCAAPSVTVSTVLTDLSGRVLRQLRWQQSASLDLSGLAAGLYLLRNGAGGSSEATLIRVE